MEEENTTFQRILQDNRRNWLIFSFFSFDRWKWSRVCFFCCSQMQQEKLDRKREEKGKRKFLGPIERCENKFSRRIKRKKREFLFKQLLVDNRTIAWQNPNWKWREEICFLLTELSEFGLFSMEEIAMDFFGRLIMIFSCFSLLSLFSIIDGVMNLKIDPMLVVLWHCRLEIEREDSSLDVSFQEKNREREKRFCARARLNE